MENEVKMVLEITNPKVVPPVPKGMMEMTEIEKVQGGSVFKDSRGRQYIKRPDGSLRRLSLKKTKG